jgi:hypothetical protein
MREFTIGRSLKRRNLASLRVDTGHDASNRPIFAAGVHPLQHNEHRSLPIRIEPLLELAEPSGQFRRNRLGLLFPLIGFLIVTGVIWIHFVQLHLRAQWDTIPFHRLFPPTLNRAQFLAGLADRERDEAATD